jgi:hypothetical protein
VAERTNYEIEIREWLSSIKQLEEEKTKYVLKAPESGFIIQFSGVQRGAACLFSVAEYYKLKIPVSNSPK